MVFIEKIDDEWLGIRGVQTDKNGVSQDFEASISNRSQCCEYWNLWINNVPFEDFKLVEEYNKPISNIQWNDKREKVKVEEGESKDGNKWRDKTENWACVDITFEDSTVLLLDFNCGHNGYYSHEVKIEFEGKLDAQRI